MEKVIKGKAWIFGNDIDTDVIIPGKYLRTTDIKSFAEHVMEGIDPQFPKKIKPGDIIVGGNNFGCGSSREQAALALKYAGVSCVIARSFGRIFFRNSINVGLPLLEVEVVCKNGDEVIIDLKNGTAQVNGNEYKGNKLPDFLLEILNDGGLVAYRKKIQEGKK